MLELISAIIFLIGFMGMAVIVFKKMPVLVEFSPEKTDKKNSHFNKIKGKSVFLLRRVFFKTKIKAKDYLGRINHNPVEKKDRFSDDFWEKIRRGK